MKATVLAGVVGVGFLTASVVVGFLQHAGFRAQTSNHRGYSHSMSQIALSAGNSEYDLSSLLETTKTEMGASTAATSAPPAVVSDVVKTANVFASDEKAPTLAEVIKGSIDTKTAPSLTKNTDWEQTKRNLDLLKDNSIRLVGKDPSEVDIKLPDIDLSKISAPDLSKISAPDLSKISAPDLSKISAPDLSKISAPDLSKISAPDLSKFSAPDLSKFSVPDLPAIGSVDVSSITQYIESLPPVAKTAAAVVAGATFLLIGLNNKKSPPPAVESEDLEAASAAVGDLTSELGTLKSRMKTLEDTGLDLGSQLKDAKTKLTQKELDISKARLQAADTSLNLNREIDLLKQKLVENDGKVKSMDEELTKARKECEALVEELEKSRKEQAKKAAAEAAALEKKKAAEAAAKVEPPPPKKVPAKKAEPKAEPVELPTAEAAAPKAAPKKAAAKKKTAAKKKAAAPKKAASKDLTTLTPSALSRTTVKVLVEFLDEKGVTTVDGDGKTLKKADLIESVKSL